MSDVNATHCWSSASHCIVVTSRWKKKILYIFYVSTGGSRFFDTTAASAICLMIKASFSVLLYKVCMTSHTVSGPIESRHGSNCSLHVQLWKPRMQLAWHAACVLQQLTSVDWFLDKYLSSVLGLCRVAVCLAQAALDCKHVTSLKATELQTQTGASSMLHACGYICTLLCWTRTSAVCAESQYA